MEKYPDKSNRKRVVSSVSFVWLLPNLLTITALIFGLSAVRYALDDRFELAVVLVVVAGIFDALDGRMARLLKSSSNFGAQLDSLSDLVVFGVVPSLIIYLFAFEDAGRGAWAACLFYIICCALRLARFNSELHDTPTWAANYFTGVPSPSAAFLVLLPIIASFSVDITPWVSNNILIGWMVIVGVLAISTIPTFAGKGVKIPRRMALPALGFFGLVIAGLVSSPWEMLLGICIIYIMLIPISILRFGRLKKRAIKSILSSKD